MMTVSANYAWKKFLCFRQNYVRRNNLRYQLLVVDMKGSGIKNVHVDVCKYVSKSLLNKSDISEYGLYCSILK